MGASRYWRSIGDQLAIIIDGGALKHDMIHAMRLAEKVERGYGRFLSTHPLDEKADEQVSTYRWGKVGW